MGEEEDLLASLLDVAAAELKSLNGNAEPELQNNSKTIANDNSKKRKSLLDVDLFSTETNNTKECNTKKKSSLIHEGDTDSSDDEDNRNSENKKYNEYGREIKMLFDHPQSVISNASSSGMRTSSWKKTKPVNKMPQLNSSVKSDLPTTKPINNVYTDPVFGISIINPLVSSKFLEERVSGRKPVPVFQISKHLKSLKKDEDWVIAGVICHNGLTKTSAKGNQFIIWTISDLLGDIKTVALFLFGSAYKEFWKTPSGTVVGILNPSILDKKEGSRDEATLSVDNAQKILIFGQSRDLGTCKSTKKNGDKCTAIVNKSKCEFCIYHIKQEYQKCSVRSDLQANYSGKGLIALRNKVLGKNEVFYAGKSYMAIPAKVSKKLQKKDQNRLQSLSGITASTAITKQKPKLQNQKAATSFDVCRNRRMKDIETLKKLGIDTDKYNTKSMGDFKVNQSDEVSLENSKANAAKILAKLNEKKSNGKSAITSNEKSISPKDTSKLQNSLNEIVENDLVDLDFDSKRKGNISSESISSTKETEKETNSSLTLPLDKEKNNAKKSIEKEQEVIKDPQTKVSENKKTLTFSKALTMNSSPSLTNNGNFIDLNRPIIPKRANKAKLNAMKFVQKNGPLKKLDPNNVKSNGTKRKFEDLDEPTNSENEKKLKKIQENEFLSDRFKKMMEIQSKHTDLIELRDNEEKEKYFKKLEIKEQLEEKMSSTYKIECKAVRCMNCKYTNFSAAEKCKAEKHRLRVFDAIKRFFKCGHCGNRIACLDVVPTKPCNNCNSSHWERTTMMKEKKITNTVPLSIRGGEQKFVNSVVCDANLNLMVPDED